MNNILLVPSKDIFNGKYESDISYIQTLYKIGLAVSEHTLSQPNVKELILGKDEFDAVLVDATQLDSLYLFAQKYSCPLIVVGKLFKPLSCLVSLTGLIRKKFR